MNNLNIIDKYIQNINAFLLARSIVYLSQRKRGVIHPSELNYPKAFLTDDEDLTF